MANPHHPPRQRKSPQAKRQTAEWALRRGAYVYNRALLDNVSDSEFEDRIGAAIEEAYWRGVARGRQTLEEQLGA